MNSFVSFGVLASPAPSPVRTCVPGGRIGCDLGDELRRRDARLRRRRGSGRACPPCRRAPARSGGRSPASVAPPIVSTEPNLTSPEIRNCSTGPSRLDADLVARPRGPSSTRSRRRSTTSPAPGQAPLSSVSVLNSGLVGSTLKPRFGAPPKTIALPSSPISCASPPTPPIAAATSGSACTSASSDSANGGASLPCPSRRGRTADLPVIVASVPLVDLGEDRVERLVDRVGEDERAADHRDAEDDRDRGQRGAQLAAERGP